MKIKDLTLPEPLTYHSTMDVYDSSKIQTFQGCPREFFYRYVVGMTPIEPNIHLVFGSAWHEAMEVLMAYRAQDDSKRGYPEDVVLFAYERFLKVYRESYPNVFADADKGAKDTGNALQALVEYAERYKMDNFKTHYIEVAGSIPISPDERIHAKVDSIIEDDNGNFSSMEHKTTGRDSQAWNDKWSYIIQPGTYTHLLRCLYPPENVKGVTINGTILRKGGNDFKRIPVNRSNEMMNQWLWEVNHWVNQIKWNFEQLQECTVEDQVMHAFPRNPESCSKFGCKFPTMCSFWGNPLRKLDQMPIGYKKEFWDPRGAQETAKAIVETDEAGKSTITKKEDKDG